MPLRFQVQGGRTLNGTIRPAGNKNAALPILASTLLADGPVVLHNVPRIRDVESMAALLADLGAAVSWTGPNTLSIDTRRAVSKPLDPALCARIRASILFAAPHAAAPELPMHACWAFEIGPGHLAVGVVVRPGRFALVPD